MAVLSVLDLSPVPEGSTVGQSLRNTLDLARHAERLGYNRYWLAEHHNMPGIASAATSVVIGHVAARHVDHPRRRGRHHAAQPFAAGHRRAVRHAGGAASRPHRSRARPRAGHRHADGAGAAPQSGGRRRHISAGRDRADQLLRAGRARPARPRGARRRRGRRSLDPGLEPMARSSPPCSACPMPSPRISRRPRWSMRSTSTARASSLRSGWRSRR